MERNTSPENQSALSLRCSLLGPVPESTEPLVLTLSSLFKENGFLAKGSVTPCTKSQLRGLTPAGAGSLGPFKRRILKFLWASKTRSPSAQDVHGFFSRRFRPTGCSVIPGAAALANKLARILHLVGGNSHKETELRCREASRLVWAASTILSLPPGREGVQSTAPSWVSVVDMGLRFSTLEPLDLIRRFKDVTTVLVQHGVDDLSPSSPSRSAIYDAASFFVPKRSKLLVRRVHLEPSIAVGLYQAKRGSAPMRASVKAEALAKNLALLTNVQDPSPDLPFVESEIRRTVQEVRAWYLRTRHKPWLMKRSQPSLPSGAATWENPRKSGGGLGFYAEGFLKGLYPGQEIDMGSIPCRRVGIPEPFKLRVISAGSALAYSRLSLFQPALWGLLKDHPAFQLIGRSLKGDDIDRFWKVAYSLFGKNALALSGDYSAATDNLNPRLSEVVMEELLEGSKDSVTSEDRTLLIAGLTGHIIDREAIPQRWGQLMGSPISFPVLCLVNAAVCRAAVEKQAQRRLTLEQAGILVNGDDCLVPLRDKNQYRSWETLVKVSGLNPSPGKCFVSRNYAQLNSALYSRRDGLRVRFLPFLRVNLLWDLQTKGLEAGKSVLGGYSLPSKLSARATDLFKVGSNAHQKGAIRNWFREINDLSIQSASPIPIHLHPSLGGLGVPYLRKRGSRWRIGPDQLKLVERLRVNPELLLDHTRGLALSTVDDPLGILSAVQRAQKRWEDDAARRVVKLVRKNDPATKQGSPPVSWVLERLSREAFVPKPAKNLLTRVRKFWRARLEQVRDDPMPVNTSELTVLARQGLGVESIVQLTPSAEQRAVLEVDRTEFPHGREKYSDAFWKSYFQDGPAFL